MVEWLVHLRGENIDLEELSKSLNSAELNIVKEGEGYVFKSTDLNNLDNVDSVKMKVTEILSIISGCARLNIGMRTPLVIDSIECVKNDGTRQVFRDLPVTINVVEHIIIHEILTDGTVQEHSLAEIIPDWVRAAQNNDNAAKALRLFGDSSPNWERLYKIYEVIEYDVGGTDIIQKNGWATKKAIKRFKHTANSCSAIGDNSRHGIEKTMQPKEPMSFGEAKSLIEGIMHRWLICKMI